MQREVPDWLDVSRETIEKLDHFASETLRWTPAINLISKASMDQIWQRHILDSAQLFPLGDLAAKWVDMGSGGGFPGIVMAIMGAQDMVLIESDKRKATFLQQVARHLSLQVTVISQRVDNLPPQGANTVSARALASLTQLLGHATPHLTPAGRAVFPKGRGADVELAAAQEKWQFDYSAIPSKTDPDAAILVIENIRRRQ
jgi:16S rRNA (guanine527-N7)-methyltransferase